MQVEFKSLKNDDFEIVKTIYEYYIKHTTVTYHIGEITIDELKEFIYINHPLYASYGIYCGNEMIGYTYFGPYKKTPSIQPHGRDHLLPETRIYEQTYWTKGSKFYGKRGSPLGS